MKTILNSFCVRTNIFQLVVHGLANVKTALATKFDPKKDGEPKHRQPPFGRAVGKIPVEITWGDEKDFEVTIKVARDSARSRKSSKRLSGAGVPHARPKGVWAARLHELAGGTPASLAA